MVDVTIGELPSLNTMEADTLIPVEHDGTAKSMAGSVMQSYVYGLVQDDVETISEIIAVGPQGEDGVSPTLSSSKSGKTTTIYYTDADHPTSTVLATLQDGADGTGVGDMLKATYDADNDGVVDDSERLGGELPSYYMAASLRGAVNGVASLDVNGLVPGSQGVAPLTTISASRNLAVSDNGWLLICQAADVTITIPAATEFPLAFEVEILRWSANTVTITAENGVSLNGTNGASKTIQNRYKSVVLKFLSTSNKQWSIQGDI